MPGYPRQVDREYLPCVPEASTRSRWLTAVLLTFTTISSRAIVGVGTSLNTNCPPYSNNLTAFMKAFLSSRALQKRFPILRLRPRLEVVKSNVGKFAAKRGAIHRKTDAVEPFIHLGGIRAH